MTDPHCPPNDQPGPHSASGAHGAAVPARLDEAALAKLRELDPDGRRGVVTRVLTAFESSLVRWLGQLEAESGQINAAAVSSIAHTLKSSAGSVGAKDLALACADLERRLRSGEVLDVAAEAAHVVTLGHAALAAIRAMLRS